MKKKDETKKISGEVKKPGVNFIRNIIEKDLKTNAFAERRWAGSPAPASEFTKYTNIDSARIRTRFPPEPNGYLHLGHAKSICLNFGVAENYNGICHLRFDDTNPISEDDKYVKSIVRSVKWLGFDWRRQLFFASDYFEYLYSFAILFIKNGDAFVDSMSFDQIKDYRGTLTTPGTDSPFRSRSVEENLDIFEKMRLGEFKDGSHVLRLKIDMKSPNINLRDPVIYRIRHEKHHKTGKKWCIYPMYDYTHCISDALENITHSLCTLEFEDHRVLYDWILTRLVNYRILEDPLPKQYEFSRLNLTHVVLSKRKLIQLVDEKHVDGWDDPRMPTLEGVKRRGYPPEGIKLFCEKIGVSKSDSLIDYTLLEDSIREILDQSCDRRFLILNPLKLIIENFPNDLEERCNATNHPKDSKKGEREILFTRELWIEQTDFEKNPPKGFFRLYPGNKVRLKYGFIVECTGYDQDENGKIQKVFCRYFPESKSGTSKSNTEKVKGNIHWLSSRHSIQCKVNLFDRLFLSADPLAKKDFLKELNPNSKTVKTALVEPSLINTPLGKQFQFERHGYFILDHFDEINNMPIFNRTVTLRDTWGKRSNEKKGS